MGMAAGGRLKQKIIMTHSARTHGGPATGIVFIHLVNSNAYRALQAMPPNLLIEAVHYQKLGILGSVTTMIIRRQSFLREFVVH